MVFYVFIIYCFFSYLRKVVWRSWHRHFLYIKICICEMAFGSIKINKQHTHCIHMRKWNVATTWLYIQISVFLSSWSRWFMKSKELPFKLNAMKNVVFFFIIPPAQLSWFFKHLKPLFFTLSIMTSDHS